MPRTVLTRLILPCALALLSSACDCGGTNGNPDGSPPGRDGGPNQGMDAARPDGGPPFDSGPFVARDGAVVINEDGGLTWTCVPITCEGHATECGDCMDNDGDGLTDSRDPECLGPCDNTEGPQLTTGVGGEGGASCNRDCYFNFGNGSGEGECRWDTSCDPKSPDAPRCTYDDTQLGSNRCPNDQPAGCVEQCQTITPNGCDCFGCCTFDALEGRSEAEGGEWVWLGSGIGDGPGGEGTCTLANLNDTAACHPCTPQEDCFNDCGECELCVGRNTIPDYCTNPPPRDAGPPPDGGYPDGGRPDAGTYPPPRCPADVQPCGLPGDANCPNFYYCVTGCCQPTLI